MNEAHGVDALAYLGQLQAVYYERQQGPMLPDPQPVANHGKPTLRAYYEYASAVVYDRARWLLHSMAFGEVILRHKQITKGITPMRSTRVPREVRRSGVLFTHDLAVHLVRVVTGRGGRTSQATVFGELRGYRHPPAERPVVKVYRTRRCTAKVIGVYIRSSVYLP